MIDDEFVSVATLGRDSNQYYELMLEQKELSSLQCYLNQQRAEQASVTAGDIQHLLQYYAFQVDERFSKKAAFGK